MKKIILGLAVFAMVAGSAFADWTKIIATGLDVPVFKTTVEFKDDSTTEKKATDGFGVNWDGQFRLVKDNGFSFMWDMDAGYAKVSKPYSSMPVDCDGFDFSFLFGVGKNFAKSPSNKLILSGVVGFDTIIAGFNSENSSIIDGDIVTREDDWLMAEVNFLAGLDFYFSHKFDSAFGIFASCTAVVGAGGSNWRWEKSYKINGEYKSNLGSTDSGSDGNSQIFVVTPKVGFCWTF